MSLAGKTCIVTGATSGIGKATALELAARGADVAIVARDAGRADAVAAEMASLAGGRRPAVFLADLGVQADVRRAAGEILARCPRIDVLVNNAAVVNLQRTTTPDGIETVFAVNHLAYFLLTLLLLDRLRESAPARIVNVASEAHRFVSGIQFDDLGFEQRYKVMRVYGHSKLANLLFTAELARRLQGTEVTANAVHPGAVATGLGKNNGRLAQVLIRMLAPFFRLPDRGAETSLYAVTSPETATVNGGYFKDCRPATPSAAARDSAAAQRLWEVSERLTGLAAGA
jgi:retinol dehydrogenase-12